MRNATQLLPLSIVLISSLALAEIDLNNTSVMATTGLNGIGVEAVAPYQPDIQLRAALAGLKADANESKDGINAQVDVNLLQAGGFVDYFPVPGNSFYLSAGLVANQQKLDVRATSLNINGGVTTNGQVTSATLTDGNVVSIDASANGTTRISYGGENYDIDESETYQVDGKFIQVVNGEVRSYNTQPTAGSTPDSTESPEQLLRTITGGSLVTNAEVQPKYAIAPYLGMGSRYRFGEQDRWVVDINGGVLITGGMEADVSVKCTSTSISCDALQKEFNEQIETVRKDIKDIEDLPGAWPFLRVALGYQF